MTNPAPPARTPLTPEERAQAALIGAGELKFGTLVRVADAIRAAETAARAEGRLAGLREAAELVENLDYPLDCGPGFVLDAAADAVRRLAEDALKAPKTPEIPAGKQG